jgi:hypothetical protein
MRKEAGKRTKNEERRIRKMKIDEDRWRMRDDEEKKEEEKDEVRSTMKKDEG